MARKNLQKKKPLEKPKQISLDEVRTPYSGALKRKEPFAEILQN